MERSSPVELLARACASTGKILESVSRPQLELPTPCSGWQVRDLIDHVAGATDFFADLAESGSSPDDREWPSYSEGDFAASFGAQARRLVTAFSAHGAMDRTMHLPTGPAPGSVCIQVATGEIFIHGWDLAKSTGQLMPDAAVAEGLLASTWPSMCAAVRNGDSSVFAAEIQVPARAQAIDRLVGFLGREPGWVRPAGS